MAMLVFPAPVGAEMRRFSLVKYATSNTMDCMRFRVFVPVMGCDSLQPMLLSWAVRWDSNLERMLYKLSLAGLVESLIQIKTRHTNADTLVNSR